MLWRFEHLPVTFVTSYETEELEIQARITFIELVSWLTIIPDPRILFI